MKKQTFIYILVFILGVAQLNATSLRIDESLLSKNLNSYKILDTRTNDLYKQGHIEGALNFPIGLTYEEIKENGQLTTPIKMQFIIQKLGLNIDSKIVIYDDGAFFDAARLFWALEVYGFTDVKLLNSGYNNWKSQNYPISTVVPSVKESNYIAQVNRKRLATKFSTQIATKNPNQIIIDARGSKAYNGEVSSAKRFGHIPNAVNFPASHNISYEKTSNKLKTIDKLKDLYKDVDKNKKIVLYCAIGKVSSANYFALRELNYDVANYDASWREWGNDTALPIINPSKK